MAWIGGGTNGTNPEDLRAIVRETIEIVRPPWYERTPWSWGIGAVLTVATSIIGAGIIHWLGWS